MRTERKIHWFRRLGYVEGISLLLLLFIAMPLKYIYGKPIYVRIIGMIHGILFILYVSMLAYLSSEKNWSTKKSVMGFLSAILPFGPFWFDKYLKEETK